MDDQATYEDFADKLNADFEKQIPSGARVDILCHSTGALVTRMWLASRRKRQRKRRQKLDMPVDRLFMFAPANFGSDLARMGQSFLGRLRCTFFNDHVKKGNRWESGQTVLQGLEPASPFQWNLSVEDLHEETYFGPQDPSGVCCYPFVFAAGEGYEGLQSKIVRDRNKPGTDGTVRICGTDMNTRKCSLIFTEKGEELIWERERKHHRIPFVVFQGFNHGSIINPDDNGFDEQYGPGSLLLKAAAVQSQKDYDAAGKEFQRASEENYAVAKNDNKDVYQQFFFRVRDDAGFPIEDYHLDFSVETPIPKPISKTHRIHPNLSAQFAKVFTNRVTVHSVDRSHRAFLVDLKNLHSLLEAIREKQARIVLDVSAKKPYDEVSYDNGQFVIHDAAQPQGNQPTFIYPNTTTLVEIVMNRRQSDEVLQIR